MRNSFQRVLFEETKAPLRFAALARFQTFRQGFTVSGNVLLMRIGIRTSTLIFL